MKHKAANGASGAFGHYQLRVLATSDLHACVMPYDYTWDMPLPSAGLARTASLIRAARAEVFNSLLVDNGDFLQGNPLGEMAAFGGRIGPSAAHPVIAAMNATGYDAATLGNHEFSYGLPFLSAAIAQATFPIIGANALTHRGGDPVSDRHFCPPTLILEKHLTADTGAGAPLKIGLIGFLPPQVEIWESKHLAGQIYTRDIVETAGVWVPRLRAEGADIVIALCHSGFGAADHSDRMENAAIPLAAIKGIDALIAGHIHLDFPNSHSNTDLWPHVDSVRGSVHGKPAVMAGFWGSHLGIIDLDLRLGAEGWTVDGFTTATRPIAQRQPNGQLQELVGNDRAVENAVRACHTATIAYVRKPVGKTDIALHSYFARLTDSAAMQILQDAQRDWLAEVVRDTEYEGLPILSAASPFKSGGRGGPQYFTDIPKGDLLLRHIADLYVFPNSIRAVRVTGATLHNWLERAAAQFMPLTAGVSDQPLFDPEAASYNFDIITGVSYEIDLTAQSRYGPHGGVVNPRSTRIQNLRYAGAPVDPDAWFLIATNNFRASGGGAFPDLDGGNTIIAPRTLSSDILAGYVARNGPVSPRADHNWRLKPLPPGTAAWFDTGPRARLHLHEVAALGVQPVGDTADGFLRCLLQF